MKKIFNQSFLFIFIFLGFASCEKVEKIERIGSIEPKITVNCLFEQGEKFDIYVSKSLSSLDNADIKPIKNAKVELYENNNLIETIAYNNTSNSYISNTVAEKGKIYKLMVSAPGLKKVEATSQIPDSISVAQANIKAIGKQAFDTVNSNNLIFKGATLELELEQSKNQFYRMGLTSVFESNDPNNFYTRMSYFNWNSTDPTLEANTYDYQSSIASTQFYFNNNNSNAKRRFSFSLRDGNYNYFYRYGYYFLLTGIQVKIEVLDKDLYAHLLSVGLYRQNSGDYFAEPVQIYSNISNGYGIFSGVYNKEIVVQFPY